jgi:hypothetical protein
VFIASVVALMLVPQPSHSAALEQFFTGVTEGSGTVEIILSGKHGMRDRNRGRIDSQGALVIDSLVEEEGKPLRKRSWRLVRSATNKISGTISDAKGAVTGEFNGGTLHLRYRLIEGPSVVQTITLQPGGRTAVNRMTIHRFGFKVATVESVLRKVE